MKFEQEVLKKDNGNRNVIVIRPNHSAHPSALRSMPMSSKNLPITSSALSKKNSMMRCSDLAIEAVYLNQGNDEFIDLNLVKKVRPKSSYVANKTAVA